MRPNILDVGRIYGTMMEEVKARTETVFEFANGLREPLDGRHHRHNIFIFEGLYLHLRKICELLALSSLLIHNCDDLERPIGKMDEIAADKLINLVSKFNPDGFPRPVSIGSVDQQRETIHLRDDEFVFTGADLRTLYHTCGEILHVGRLRDILNEKQRNLDQIWVIQWCEKLIKGLGTHAIGFPDGERFLFVVMQTPDIPNVICRLLTRE